MKTLKNFSRAALTLAFALAANSALSGIANAQTMTPLRQMVTSYEDRFAIKVNPKNPYKHRIDMVVRVYDENFRLIKARVTPRRMKLGAGGSRPVTVMVPFEGKSSRKIRICAESTPFPKQKTKIKARVCGRFMAKRAR